MFYMLLDLYVPSAPYKKSFGKKKGRPCKHSCARYAPSPTYQFTIGHAELPYQFYDIRGVVKGLTFWTRKSKGRALKEPGSNLI